MQNNGVARTGSDLQFLEFAADVATPTSMRRLRWDSANNALVQSGATSAVTAADTVSYKLLVLLKAYAKTQYMRGIRENGEETFHVFLTPQAMAKLKLDPDYIANLRYAATRGDSNELFTGGTVKVDGLYIHEFRHVYNTSGAASGSKWGAAGAIDGCQMLFCGAQALAMADIGDATWVEKGFDYDNQQAISTGKIAGFLKPRFNSIYSGNTVQDFGALSVYVAQ
jgi:N4-gp56 family major capsid protein